MKKIVELYLPFITTYVHPLLGLTVTTVILAYSWFKSREPKKEPEPIPLDPMEIILSPKSGSLWAWQ